MDKKKTFEEPRGFYRITSFESFVLRSRINYHNFSDSLQDISAVAKSWKDSPYLFIVKVQPLFRGGEDDDIGAEQLSFAFTSERHLFTPKPLESVRIYSVDTLMRTQI